MGNWTRLRSEDGKHGYAVLEEQIEKPDLDDRDYRVIELDNGLRAILVHDAGAEKAAACLTVQVGAMHDPDDMPGLAHFCEHMLLKGTEAYPEENDFFAYITSHGGSKNASTSANQTNYWFSIGSSYLFGALPRLAAFFHSPLFTESLTKREIYAVDNEHRRNIQTDSRRVFMVDKMLGTPGHPYTRFQTGNVESITEAARKELGIEVVRETREEGDVDDEQPVWKKTRDRLVEWWREHYCAGRMTLAVLGTESLDELTKSVVSLFSPVKNLGLDLRPVIATPLWGASEMGSVIYIKTVKDTTALTLKFPLPDQWPHYRSKPARVLAHLLGHEGPGSVCAYLRRKGELGVSTGNPSVQFLQVKCHLTREGYAHYKEVLAVFYDYLALLRSSNIEPYHFDELKRMSEINFRYEEKTQPHTYVGWLARELAHPYPSSRVLSASSLFLDWDEGAVRDLIDNYLLPDKGRAILEAREHPGVDGWEKERWYGVEYCARRIDADLSLKPRGPGGNKELFLPGPNQFIPRDLSVEKSNISMPAPAPVCIYRSSLSALWHKKDDRFWVPRASAKIDIRSPLAYGTPRQAVLTRMIADLVEDALSEVAYDAYLAGFNYDVTNHKRGIRVSVSGYSDKLDVVLGTVIRYLKNLQVDPRRLDVVKEQVTRAYENHYLGQPSDLSEEFAEWAMTHTVWTPADKLPEIPLISVEDVQVHHREFLGKVSVVALVTGNLRPEQAVAIVKSVEDSLRTRPCPSNERFEDRALVVPPGANVVLRQKHANTQELNSSLSYCCQFGEVADETLRPIVMLLTHIMRSPVFDQLRTQEQLGYVVSSTMWVAATSMGFGINIQSTRAPWYLEERVDAFLEQFRSTLAEMSQEDFAAEKEGLIVKLLERPKNLHEETLSFWAQIRQGYYDFMRRQRDASAIKALSLDEVIKTYDTFVRPSTGRTMRKKLSVQLVSQQLKEAIPLRETGTVLTDSGLTDYKSSMACYRAAVPVGCEFGRARVLAEETAKL
ncbi:LuxS/MPP-like metallohydrolase [Fomitopsis serialis]|uniref:LuxS/MPP-like metallohydrolase n=1 Tax=Fomitopsis serialis TaxID=139415 RepID=UPI00200777FA|nr:LuxS/MPP-like metallohydrolase [Neoantrodia serialis]KAH9915085.1 LuxS/MPP-like metallohydrolase [Neoantrodia serialis]